MPDAPAVARALADCHELFNTVRAKPAAHTLLPGAIVMVRAGEDSEFPSSAGNRLFVYDHSAADLIDTVRAARALYDRAGVSHWFLKLGPGAQPASILALVRELSGPGGPGIRPWPHVRYPVLARVPGPTLPVQTTLQILRAGPEHAQGHAAEVDQIWDKPGASSTFVGAAARPGFVAILGLDGDRAVAMGMLAISGGVAYLCAGGTHRDFRRRGGQSAIIAERIRVAHELGCSLCISETVSVDQTSEQNLLRAGFERAFDWGVYEIGPRPAESC